MYHLMRLLCKLLRSFPLWVVSFVVHCCTFILLRRSVPRLCGLLFFQVFECIWVTMILFVIPDFIFYKRNFVLLLCILNIRSNMMQFIYFGHSLHVFQTILRWRMSSLWFCLQFVMGLKMAMRTKPCNGWSLTATNHLHFKWKMTYNIESPDISIFWTYCLCGRIDIQSRIWYHR